MVFTSKMKKPYNVFNGHHVRDPKQKMNFRNNKLYPTNALTNKIDTRKYSSFRKYLKTTLQASLITSLPEIASSRNWLIRLIKIAVFVCCVVGFAYQSNDFMSLYSRYPTVVNVDITNPYEFIQPAVTVCNRNRFRRSKFCEMNRDRCTFYTDFEFSQNFTRTYSDTDTSYLGIPDDISAYLNRSISWKDTFELAHTKEIFSECRTKMKGKEVKCLSKTRTETFLTNDGFPNLCYTIYSQIGEPASIDEIYPNTFEYILLLDAQAEEYPSEKIPIYLQLSIHDRRAHVNPYDEGYPLEGGQVYNAYVTMEETESLRAPYDSNCTDYLSLWRARRGEGPLNQMMCIEECKFNMLKKQGLCIDKDVAYPHREKMCDRDTRTVTPTILRTCSSQCGKACSERKYLLHMEKTNNFNSACFTPWCRVGKVRLTIYFKKFKVTKYKHQAKFESVEVFSYIGGYMGMWLGLSLVSLFDFLETICYIIQFPIVKHQLKKKGQLRG